MKKLLGLFFLSACALGAVTERDKSELGTYKNYATNGGAESSKSGWSISGTSSALTNLAVDTDAADRYSGNAGFTWTPANADNYLSNAAYTITANGQLSSRNCAVKVFTKTSATGHALEAYDGTNVLATTTISASTGFILTTLNFGCPSSGTAQIRFNAGDTTAITFDDLSWGDAYGVNLQNVSQAQFIGAAYIPGTTSCGNGWTRSSTTPGIVGTDTDCPGPTVEFNPGPGTIQTTDTDLPRFTVNNLPPGTYRVEMSVPHTQSAGVNALLSISDGTTRSGDIQWAEAGTEPFVAASGVFIYTSAGNRTFDIYVASSSGSVAINNGNLAGTGRGVRFALYRYPSSSELAVNVDQTPSMWSGYHDSTCSWSTTSATYVDPSDDASCALTTRQNTNLTVSSSGSVSPAITFTPKKAGSFFVCANPILGNNGANNSSAKLTDGTTVIGDANVQGTIYSRIPICGIYNATSLSSVTLKIQITAAAGTAQMASVNSTNAIEWSIIQVSPQFSNPQIINGVTSSSSGGVRIATAYLTNSGSCAVSSQDGSWISSVGDPGIGRCTINIAAGTFSATPRCHVTVVAPIGNPRCTGIGTDAAAPTSTQIEATVSECSTGNGVDNNFNITCIGAK